MEQRTNKGEMIMAIIKSYTDIKQSRKLAEILQLESADMYYKYILPRSNKLKHIPSIGNPIESLKWFNKGYTAFGKEPLTLNEYCILCWSLQALLDEIPYTIMNKQEEDLKLHIEKDGLQYYLFYENEYNGDMFEIETDMYDNMIDACVEMIIKLSVQNLI